MVVVDLPLREPEKTLEEVPGLATVELFGHGKHVGDLRGVSCPFSKHKLTTEIYIYIYKDI